MASPKPAVIVRREFEATPEFVAQQLRACIVGPSCQLVRFNQAAEKAKGFIATINTDSSANNGTSMSLMPADLSYSIPSLASTSSLDLQYTKVFAQDALLTYAHIARDTGNFALAQGDNSVTLSSNSWKGAGRYNALVQDVAVGDIIQFYTTAGLQHTSTVSGFTASAGASAAISNIGLNSAATVAANSVTPSSGVTVGGAAVAVSITNYLAGTEYAADPRIVGKLSTEYTITITGYTDGNVNYTVVSDTGLDSAVATNKASAAATTLPSGATVTLTYAALPPVGAQTKFSIGAGHTKQTVGLAKDSPDYAIGGTISAAAPSTTYIITCTKGGSLKANAANSGVSFKVFTNNGADAPSNFTLLGGATESVNIGSFGLTLAGPAAAITDVKKGFVKGDTITVTLIPSSSGNITTLVFADAAPAAITGAATNRIRLSKKKTVEIPAESLFSNWSVTNPGSAADAKIKLENTMTLRDSSVNAGGTELYVTAGNFYMQYRAFQELPRQIGSVSTLSDITTQLGTIDPDNILAYGVYKAFSNANGAIVHFIPTVSPTLNGYRGFADALSLAKGNRNCYSMVPLSNDSQVWDAFVAHVKDESAPETGRFRIAWIAPEINQHNKILDKDTASNDILVSSGGSAYSTGKWQIDTTQATKFTESVQAGDWVRVITGVTAQGAEVFKEYKVSAVLDNNSLVIDVGNEAISWTSQKIEIFRDLTAAALANRYVQVAGGYSSERVFAVVPDRGINGLRSGGIPVKNWNVACAYAGLRSGSRPQQPLSNVELLGFDGVNISVPVFDEAELTILRDGGVWVVRNNEEGKIYVERQLSTSTLDTFRKEQSVTSNVDSIAFTLSDALKNLVGRVTITEDTTALVRALIEKTLLQLSTTAGAVTVGPQLNNFTIGSITVPATAQDSLVVRISIAVPLPMNIIDITLVI